MSVVRRSVIFSAASQYLIQLLTLATTAVMARLLTPEETGQVMVVFGVIMLIESFRDFGVVTFIVQERTLTTTAIRTAFTVSLGLSLMLGAALFFTASWIAGFFGEPVLEQLIVVGALGFAVVPFATPTMGLLRREMSFETIARVNVASAFAHSSTAIGLAVAGAGPISYLWGALAAATLSALFAFRARPNPWMFRLSLADWRAVSSFGLMATSCGVINSLSDVLPRFALGRLLGFDAVGLYTRALTLCALPDRLGGALQPVVLPAMAARARSSGDLKEVYLRGHALMSGLQWPGLVTVALLAEPIVTVLLGRQWLPVAPLAQVMALATMALAPAFMTYPVLVAAGRVRDTVVASLISLPPSMLIVLAAATVSLEAVAGSLLVTTPMQMVVALLFIRRAIALRWTELLRASIQSFVVTLATAAPQVLVILSTSRGFDLNLGQAMVAAGAAALAWLWSLHLVRHPLAAEPWRFWMIIRNDLSRFLPACMRLQSGQP
jgi:O-antigen/teichoic acid export membrane protein